MNIQFSRPRQPFDLARRYRIVVDGAKVGGIWESERKSLRLPDAAQKLYAKIDWARSPVLDLSTLKPCPVTLEVSNAMPGWMVFVPFLPLLLSLLFPHRYLRISVIKS